MRAVITVTGNDSVGIIARVSKLLSENDVNIADISQTTYEGKFFMVMLVEIANKIKDKISDIDYIVYPPVNKKTFYKRGYNQMELISKDMSKLLNIKMLKNCIYKTRENCVAG